MATKIVSMHSKYSIGIIIIYTIVTINSRTNTNSNAHSFKALEDNGGFFFFLRNNYEISSGSLKSSLYQCILGGSREICLVLNTVSPFNTAITHMQNPTILRNYYMISSALDSWGEQ